MGRKKIEYSDMRWNGHEWEMHMGYPLGHVSLNDELHRLDVENAELKARLSKAVDWISVKDRLPDVEMEEHTRLIDGVDNGKSFLICSEDGYVDIDTFWAKAKEFNCDDVAYWMPLPEPPKER